MTLRRLTVAGVALGAALVLVVVVLAVVVRSGPPSTAGFTPPTRLPTSGALARNRLVFDSDRTGNFELFAMRTNGRQVVQLTHDAAYDSWSPRLSPDRRTILFMRTPAGTHDLSFTKASIWAVSADGSGVVELRPRGADGWAQQGHPEWSPSQDGLVMFGGSRLNPQIYLTDALGQHPRAVTKRGGTNLDPAFTPDGRSIVFVGCPRSLCQDSQYEIMQVALDGGAVQRLTFDRLRDHDPMYSPNGRDLAWLTSFGGSGAGVWDIRVRTADGLVARVVGDRGITSRPEWSANGRTIYTHRVAPGGRTFGVFRMRPDGSGSVELTAGQPGTNEYPSP